MRKAYSERDLSHPAAGAIGEDKLP